MGVKITFPVRGRECATADAGTPVAASLVEPRVKFVPGYLGAGSPPAGKVSCGDGTLYPMETTVDQIAEIYYRVKDSVFSGSMTETWDSTVNTVGFSGTPAAELVTGLDDTDADWFCRRGYSAQYVTDCEEYFGAAYPVSAGDTGLSGDFYDVGLSELAMWLPSSSVVEFNGPSSWRTGFHHEFVASGSTPLSALPARYLAYHNIDGFLYGAMASLVFNGRIAWVDDNSSGNPLDPLNRRFLGMEFRATDVAYTGAYDIGTNAASVNNTLSTGVVFELALSNSVVISCPLYCQTNTGDETYSGAIRVTATAWWPYDKTGVGADPAWNTLTGVKL